jgi:hypothetical protein
MTGRTHILPYRRDIIHLPLYVNLGKTLDDLFIEAMHLQIMHLLSLIVKGNARGYTDNITPCVHQDVDWLAIKCVLDTDSIVSSDTQDVFEVIF